MKGKLKKWHIGVFSVLILFLAVIASLMSLKATTVDEEETPEELIDNWEISTVFYDSSVDNGKTPLTSINWDASDTSYLEGDPRVITVQINYDNDNAVTTYELNELMLSIPNLAYNNNANWNVEITVGGNDDSHINYDWNFISGTLPSIQQPYLVFSNAKVVEEKANFEGSIQIVYVITPKEDYPEEYDDSCTVNHNVTLQATLKIFDNIEFAYSPNYPDNYNFHMEEAYNYWEYENKFSSTTYVTFTPDSSTYNESDYISIYDKNSNLLYRLYGKDFGNQTFCNNEDYMKIAMKSDGRYCDGKFSAIFSSSLTEIKTNEITFNYTRTYYHPWEQVNYTITKKASKITSLDGFPAGEYYWVAYEFKIEGYNYPYAPYPNIVMEKFEIRDVLPEGCIVLDSKFNLVTIENNEYKTSSPTSYNSATYRIKTYVGYPKSTFNEEAGNLNITNHVDLYVQSKNETELTFEDDAEVSINLADFDFAYTGDLYGITKTEQNGSKLYSRWLLDDSFLHSCSSCKDGHITTSTQWNYSATAVYTGSPMTVRLGDDLLYITDEDGNYRKLNDDEYWIESFSVPKITNKNGTEIKYNKYNSNLYVRYANEEEFVLHSSLSNARYDKPISFANEDKKIVAFYIQIDDMAESFCASNPSSYSSLIVAIKPQDNIAPAGTIYNFAFLEAFFKDSNGNLVLQNEATLSNYITLATQDNIATHDLATYGHYIQRDEAKLDYAEYESPVMNYRTDAYKVLPSAVQDAENEVFVNTHQIGFYSYNDPTMITEASYLQNIYLDHINELDLISGYCTYDLLPKGMEIVSSHKDIFDSIFSKETTFYQNYYNKEGNKAFSSHQEFVDFIKEHSTINIYENWKDTGRTKIEWIVEFSDYPLFFAFQQPSVASGPLFLITFDTHISYDNYVECGSVYTDYTYVEGSLLNSKKMAHSNSKVVDSGYYDMSAFDINENKNIVEYLAYKKASITITSAVSTHQDVTTFVQTGLSNYSTGIVDALTNDEYQYKLRVRTGATDVTNLIVYSNLEEAQPERTRWKGEFLGIDTSFAESKGYIVKTYYSENSAAGKLYNNDGSLNSDWELYSPTTYTNGLSIKFSDNCATAESFDYLYIYYHYNGSLYRSNKYYGKNLSGLTVDIPSTDFYLYWYTDNGTNNAYGLEIDSISPKVVTTAIGSSGQTLPAYQPIELSGSNYPETTHSPYDNKARILWHYTGNTELVSTGTNNSNVKSLAFEYLDANGNAAILSANSLTYVLINMKAPDDENETRLARNNCWTEWNAVDEFGGIVDGIVGINSNVVKVALPNSVKTDDMPSISLNFTKEITGSETAFENMNLNKTDDYIFAIRLTSLTANDDGTYNQVTGLLSSNTGLIISQIPIGTYLLEELGDNYFDFVEFTNNNDPEIVINGVTFEKANQGYIITVSEGLSETIEFNIKVTNEIEDERFYEEKHNKENLFLINKNELDHDVPQD